MEIFPCGNFRVSSVVLLSLLSAEPQFASGHLMSGFFKAFVEKVRLVLRKFKPRVLTRADFCGIIVLQYRDFGRGLSIGASHPRYVKFKISNFWEFGGYRYKRARSGKSADNTERSLC